MSRPETDGRAADTPQPRPQGPLGRLLWRVPLGWQLSGLYTVLLAVTLILVGALVYKQQETFFVQDAGTRLEQAATQIAARPAQFSPDGGGGGYQGGLGGGPPGGDRGGPGGRAADPPALFLEEILIRGLSGRDVTVAVLDTTGAVLTTTQGLTGDTPRTVDAVSAAQIAAVQAGGPPQQWVSRRADGTRQVVVLQAVTWNQLTGPGGAPVSPVTLLVEQSASLAASDAALVRLGTYLLLGVLAGTLAGVVLGLAFTRAVLRPLDRVADTADAIAEGDLARRLRLPPGRNEVARLGHAFDTMVGRLVATLEAQRRFVADASHELRTPLTSLKGLAEILMIGAHGDDSRVIEDSARAIHSELDRLSRLVNDLLTLSRLDSSDANTPPPARRIRMDVCATLAGAALQMSALAEAGGVRLVQTCAAPLWLAGDPGQLKQVLLNLLDNALRHTPPGGEVTLRGTAVGGQGRIEVRDTGAGIAPGDLPHIFERFYRGDTSRSRATGNSGLGLAIVGAIVEAHGGAIAVESTLGAGTCFTITLPLAPARAAAPAESVPVEVAARR